MRSGGQAITRAKDGLAERLLRGGKLVWRGALAAEPTLLEVAYSAVGQRIVRAGGPPRRHPRPVRRVDGGEGVGRAAPGAGPPANETGPPGRLDHYTWAYQRLLFGQPVRLDVLGVALIDRLGELTWLGPLSVVIFGLIVGLVVRAA
jgi:hypothetical protein